jgi:hypothetical protein
MNFKQNYKEKLALEKTHKMSAGLVADRYSCVSAIIFQLKYYQSAFNRVLMTRTLSFIPANYAYFHLDCVKNDCCDGGFDLSPIVDDMIKNRKQTVKGTMFCKGKKILPRAPHAPDHARLCYEITVKYGNAERDTD